MAWKRKKRKIQNLHILPKNFSNITTIFRTQVIMPLQQHLYQFERSSTQHILVRKKCEGKGIRITVAGEKKYCRDWTSSKKKRKKKKKLNTFEVMFLYLWGISGNIFYPISCSYLHLPIPTIHTQGSISISCNIIKRYKLSPVIYAVLSPILQSCQ